MEDEYLIEYADIASLSVRELINELKQRAGLKIKDLRIDQLIFYKEQPIYTGCGVYIFRHKQQIFYVGKNSARCFVERIPSHFDIRSGGWFNRLLRLICQRILDVDDSLDENLTAAAKYGIDNFDLILINFQWEDFRGDKSIERLEDLLRMTTDAANSFKTKRFADLEVTVGSMIQKRKHENGSN